MNAKAKAAVSKGAKLLDRKKRGWALKICVPDLDLGSVNKCILGYVYADKVEQEYGDGYGIGKAHLFDDDWKGIQSGKHGFNNRMGAYSTLRKFWIVEIGKRLARVTR